ncbi:Ankyrin-3 [Hypsibius exemplaris]|uniref:Ankyrin-3 n=1 Tax=Hypsibius exemplaris TaxID=2072580 RepID=A0A9X6NG83_HYPEX|nr:Ankyrin-3 [Hypsibius exemplaris]
MAFLDFTFAPPSEPPPKYVPDYQPFHDLEDAALPGLNGKHEVPPNFGRLLLDACQSGNWILADHFVRELEAAWRAEDGHAGVRTAVNFQDPDDGMCAIVAATRQNKTAFVEKLANLGADVNLRIKDTSTALHYATASLKEDMVKLLISSGADATMAGGPLHQLPLHVGCMRKHGAFPIVQYLLYLSGEDARMAEDAAGETPLWRAAAASHIHLVKELLKQHGFEQLSYQNKMQNGDTVMHAVLRRNQTELLHIFLEAGAPVDAQNFDGVTLLHVAVGTSNKAALELLHQYHANPILVDKYDRTPLHLAVEKGLDQIVDLFTDRYKGSIHIRTKDGSTLAHIAALSGHPETVLTLLKRGVYLHMPNKSGALALHAAARTGHAPVVKALLARGSRVDAKTRDNYTALHLAIEYGKPNVVEVVLGAGASVHTKGGKNGETPLHIAARVPNGERSAWALLKCGASVIAKLENGETALHVAARAGAMKMVQILLQEKADPLAVSVAGETPFHIAVRACHFDIAKELLDFIVAKWDRYDAVSVVNMANVEGETPLHFVAEIIPEMVHGENDDLKLLQLVLDYNADAGAQTRLTLETPLHYCARNGSEHILAALLKSIGSDRAQTIINRQSNTGWSPLLTASEGGQVTIVKMLLKNHARVDVFDEMGKAALHIAAENGHLELVDLLLRSKAFVNAKTKLGVTALHLAAMKGWPEIVQLLVEKHAATVDSYTIAMKTPLHLAAQHGKLDICEMLLKMGASPLATDDHGQNPLHVAAECDNEAIVQLFLKVLADKNPLHLADMKGHTIAHIAAKNGSDAVMELLLRFNKNDTVSSKNKSSDSTVLHVAAAGGHIELVKMLLAAGSSPAIENADGMTAMHLAAKYGHLGVIDVLREVFSPKISSLKNGLTALHLASYCGQAEAARELLTVVPATVRSDEPSVSTATGFEIGCEAGLTALHLACKSGQEAIVRLLLNYPGVLVDVPADKTGYIPLHMAALNGHVAVVGLLLSRTGSQLNVPDAKGQTPLMIAAVRGHVNMAALLIGQGADLTLGDHNGWTALHCAAVAGHPEMVTLLCESGADTTALSKDKKIPLCYAVHAAHQGRQGHEGHVNVMAYLMQQKFSSFSLMDDSVFLMDMMHASKSQSQKPLFNFIKWCSSPMEIALKLSKFYFDTADRDKYHAKDLTLAAKYCSQVGERLLTLSCSKYNASEILRAEDRNGLSLMDMLVVENHKQAVALVPVQSFLTSIWYGGLKLSQWQIVLTFIVFLFCPPVWLVFSFPLPHHISEIPFLKLVVHITSHVYYILIMILVFMTPFRPLYKRTDLSPTPEEWLLVFWLIGNLLAEITSHEERRGLGRLRGVILVLGGLAVLVHVAAIGVDHGTMVVMLYVRCQLLATACFFADVQVLSYLSFHQLFGPFAIMLSDIVFDLMRFLVFFSVFLAGFSFSLSSLYEDFKPTTQTFPGGIMMDMVVDPFAACQLLYWAIFGLIDPFLQIPKPETSPSFALSVILILFGIYMMVTMVVLVNLLIAMLSDTYQRIKARSDLEWKFIRAKIIINMEKTPISPPPINILTLTVTLCLRAWTICRHRNAMKRVGSSDEKLIASSAAAAKAGRVLGWGSDELTRSRRRLSMITKDSPPKKLTDVAPWKTVLLAYEEEEDRGFDDDYYE